MEEQIVIMTDVDKIFAYYKEVNNWPSWDPTLKAAYLEGEFKNAAKGVLVPDFGPKLHFTLSHVVANQSFTTTTNLPMCEIAIEHLLIPAVAETKVIIKLHFNGTLASAYSLLLAEKLRKDILKGLEGLKKHAEEELKMLEKGQ